MKDAAHIHMIVDRSGSMQIIKDDVIGAINRFIDEQKAVPGECTFSFVQFDAAAPYEVVQDCVPIREAKHLDDKIYVPRGGTPLLDAIGRGIVDLGAKLSAKPEADRPSKVVFVVQTDGHENSSTEYNKGTISEMVRRQTDIYKWQFVFLGANIDAIDVGGGMGIASTSSMNFAQNAIGTQAAYLATSAAVRSYRTGSSTACEFSDSDRADAMQGS